MADKFEKFTERARKVLALAQEEARRFNHNYIGTEHLLLGLVREGWRHACSRAWACSYPRCVVPSSSSSGEGKARSSVRSG